ncbi:MAG: hypothetical protein ACJAWW_000062 [Sulfurimonas sp.]|jgi:hypothetical protein
MELKDVILSTLAEMEDNEITKKVLHSSIRPQRTQTIETTEKTQTCEEKQESSMSLIKEIKESSSDSEILFLKSLRERLLVLFEGFQAPNNTNIEAKVDMTLNFLEYALATIDSRAEQIEKGKLK